MPLLPPFVYERPSSLAELRDLLARLKAPPAYMAGGTDLIPAMRRKKSVPEIVVDLKGIPGLKGIRATENNGLWIGALTTIHELEIDRLVAARAAALAEGAKSLGSWQVRNRATIGGNLANASPTADTATPLLALEARVHIWGPAGERAIPAQDFWIGPGRPNLSPGELVAAVEIPAGAASRSSFRKLGPREAMDLAIVNAAAAVEKRDNRIARAIIALGGAGPRPIRARSAEQYLAAREIAGEVLAEAGRLAAGDSDPRSSSRASREYRLAVIPVMVERVLRAALA
jgi:carbon-monoxide dehydrogenase medium subunit